MFVIAIGCNLFAICYNRRLCVLCCYYCLIIFFKTNVMLIYSIVSQATYIPIEGERFTQPSLTVPDQVMSLQELLNRHVRGQEIPQGNLYYDEEGGELPDLRDMDLTEIDELKADLSAFVDGYRSRKSRSKLMENVGSLEQAEIPTVVDPQPDSSTDLKSD